MTEAGYAAPELAIRAQKLAELIVAECLLVVNRNIYGPCGEYDYSYTDKCYAADSRSEDIYEEIKIQFGVK